MSYDPSITQRVNKAVKNATDQFLAVDLLLKHNEDQDKKIGGIEDNLKNLNWFNANLAVTKNGLADEMEKAITAAFAVQAEKVKNTQRWIQWCLVPLAGAAVAWVIEFARRV